jgi:hypothetical protein
MTFALVALGNLSPNMAKNLSDRLYIFNINHPKSKECTIKQKSHQSGVYKNPKVGTICYSQRETHHSKNSYRKYKKECSGNKPKFLFYRTGVDGKDQSRLYHLAITGATLINKDRGIGIRKIKNECFSTDNIQSKDIGIDKP